MKSFLVISFAILASAFAAPQEVFNPFELFDNDPIEGQLGQLNEFEQEDAENLPQQQEQQQQDLQQEGEEFGALREEPQEEPQTAALQQENAELQQREQLKAVSEPQKKEEYKKSKGLGANGISGFGTPVDLKHEKEIKIKAHPKFKYQYQVHDKKTKDIKEKKEERNGHKLKGEYKLLQPDHLWRHVKYHSDKKQGWVAQVTYTKG